MGSAGLPYDRGMNERPDIKQIKAQLAAELLRSIAAGDALDMATNGEADAPRIDLARLRSGDFEDISIEDLVALLNALDRRVAITISRAADRPSASDTSASDTRARDTGAHETGRREDAPSLLEKIAAITASIPVQEWEKLPSDLAENHDHYLYGAPKRH